MKSLFSTLLAVACLVALFLAARQQLVAYNLACLAAGAICVDLLGLLRGGPWTGAAWVATMAYAVAAEVQLLILPSVRGTSWLAETGFAGMPGWEALGLWILILLPFFFAARVMNR